MLNIVWASVSRCLLRIVGRCTSRAPAWRARRSVMWVRQYTVTSCPRALKRSARCSTAVSKPL